MSNGVTGLSPKGARHQMGAAASDEQPMMLAAVLYDPSQGGSVDALLLGVADELRQQGFKLAGAVQWNAPAAEGPCADMLLEDLASGRRVRVSQDRGRLAKGCRLDSSALEEVAGLTRDSIKAGVDLVIINKFSKSEAEGTGLRQVIEAAVVSGIPVIVGLNSTHRAAWEEFCGGSSAWLPRDCAAILRWCDEALAAPATAATS